MEEMLYGDGWTRRSQAFLGVCVVMLLLSWLDAWIDLKYRREGEDD